MIIATLRRWLVASPLDTYYFSKQQQGVPRPMRRHKSHRKLQKNVASALG